MKVSLNIAQYYSNVDLKGLPAEELVQRVGLQLGAVEDTVDYTPRYAGIVVVRVVTCEKHPNADKLSLCRVDDGGVTAGVERDDEGYVQVVCGAPNVHAGMWAAWIPPRATVPASLDTDPFVLEARELRGKISNGMLASCKELDISDSHDGILEIAVEEVGREPKAGEPITNFYGLDDFVIDCENKMFTHRPDCFGNLGVARELAGINGLAYKSPEWYLNAPAEQKLETRNLKLEISVDNPIAEKVPRFTVVAMNNVTVKPSPVWLQAFLKRVGIKPINNVVDVTNYVMHLTGQPLHAFDYDKLQKVSSQPSLHPRMAKKGEKITLLGNKTVELTEEDMVIATDKQAVALAGVMGGAETEVDETTKNIVIECANFDMYTIRRTSMRHGLFTDAVTRFNKGQSPLQNDRVLFYAMKCMSDHAGAQQASVVYDIAGFDVHADNRNQVEIDVSFINDRLGSELTVEEIKSLLENVEFTVRCQGTSLTVVAPFWRMDIAIEEDIVEEVGRLYGYSKLPVVLPARNTKPAPLNSRIVFRDKLRQKLLRAGANEILTYSFVHGTLLEHCGIEADKWSYHLRNAISPDLQYYRPSLMPSMLAKVHANIKAQEGQDNNKFLLYEFGNVHVKGEFEQEETSIPKQMRRLAGVFAADQKAAKQYHGAAYYQAKRYVDEITDGQAVYLALDTNKYPVTAPYLQERAAIVMVGDQVLGVVGEFGHKTRHKLKLPEYCAGFELDVDLLREHLQVDQYQPLSMYPETTQDVTFDVALSVSWHQLEQLLHAELAVAGAEMGYEYTLLPHTIYRPDEVQRRRMSFRIVLSHPHKTLTREEVNKLLEQLSKAAHETLEAHRV